MGSGIAETTQYDVRGRLTARNAGSVYQLSGIQYEPDGNLWNVPTESVMGWWSYAYDRYGNRWAQNVTAGSGPSFNQAFNGRNQIVGFTYDANGNLTGDGRCNYAYDAENELVDVSACTSATYQYDAEGRRSRTVTGNTEDTVYDLGGRPAAVFGMVNGAPQWWWSEVYLGGRHLAIYEGSTTNFSHPDGLGTGRAWSTLSGAWLANCSSLPFGEALNCNPGDPSPSHFTGKVHDNETDFSYFGARYYSPQMGRFLTPDTVSGDIYNPQSLNLYAYAWNNPVTFTDPTGHYVCGDSSKGHECTSSADKAFAKSLASDLKSKDEAVVRAAQAYGKANGDNGVTVGFGKTADGSAGNRQAGIGADPNSPNGIRATASVVFKDGLSGSALDAAVGHEGTHVANVQDFIASISANGENFDTAKRLSVYQDESSAYLVTASVLASEGVDLDYGTALHPAPLGAGVTRGSRRWHRGPSRREKAAKFRRAARPRQPTRRGPGRLGLPGVPSRPSVSGSLGAAERGPAPVNSSAATRGSIDSILANPTGPYHVTPQSPGPLLYPVLTVPH